MGSACSSSESVKHVRQVSIEVNQRALQSSERVASPCTDEIVSFNISELSCDESQSCSTKLSSPSSQRRKPVHAITPPQNVPPVGETRFVSPSGIISDFDSPQIFGDTLSPRDAFETLVRNQIRRASKSHSPTPPTKHSPTTPAKHSPTPPTKHSPTPPVEHSPTPPVEHELSQSRDVDSRFPKYSPPPQGVEPDG
jgi:hypothetical protein